MSKAKFLYTIQVRDPDTNAPVELEVWKNNESGGIFAVDVSFLDQVHHVVNSPFNDNKIKLPEDQTAAKSESVELSFWVHGSIRQTVEITASDISANDLLELLNKGTAVTSIQENGDVVLIGGGGLKTVGRVVNVESNCEYDGFEVG